MHERPALECRRKGFSFDAADAKTRVTCNITCYICRVKSSHYTLYDAYTLRDMLIATLHVANITCDIT